MKRVWKLSDSKYFTKPRKLVNGTTDTTFTTANKPLLNTSNHKPLLFIRKLCNSQSQSTSSLFTLFTNSSSYVNSKAIQELRNLVSVLRNELVDQNDDPVKIEKLLNEKGAPLFRSYSDSVAVVMLLNQLSQYPSLALKVLNWRRHEIDIRAPIIGEEYAKGIMFAGRLKKLNLAVELYSEACKKKLKTTSIYNALMSAYMYNEYPSKCQSIFLELKLDQTCTPTIVTYNILLSVYGRLMLIDQMNTTLCEIRDLNLSPNVKTYNTMIAGYVTAWMWNSMEKTYSIMLASGVKPNLDTHLLMLRGYALSVQLDKMEEVYELVKHHVNQNGIPYIQLMICAYCNSSYVNKVTKIEELLKLIPEYEFKPWLNIRLICLYANEDLLEGMENLIKIAFECNTCVTTVGPMRCIISNYYRHNAVDNLANFVTQAESSGWKICRSLYHCKMVMYSLHNRITDMENVLVEMDRVNIKYSQKTLWILYSAYVKWGLKNKVKQVMGVMCKLGYGIPLDGRN